MNPITLTIPFPFVLGNHAWKRRGNVYYCTQELLRYFDCVRMVVKSERLDLKLNTPLRVIMEFTPPDRRRRDLGNMEKVVSDSLTKAELWADDSLVSDLRLIRLEPNKNSHVKVFVQKIEDF